MTSLCRLNPVTSLNTTRYENSACVQLCPQVITRGPAPRSSTFASKWQRFVHPEGQPYFVLTGEFAFDVVTEANIEDIRTQDQIFDCITVASKELYGLGVKVPGRCELFLELRDGQMSCNYYFADHNRKMLFWLEDLCSDVLDIPPVASSSYLEMQLERLYWAHVEFFPMHHEPRDGQFSEVIDDLYNVISHGQADRLTSWTSTFPYTADTCQQFLKLLSRKRGQRVDGYTLCYAARLAGAIASQRCVTFYGQRPAQLDRLQGVFSTDVVQHKWLFNTANLLMWGTPLHYTSLLDDLYVNEQVYADQWTHFMSICLSDWTSSLSWSLPVVITTILLANVHGGTMTASILPLLSCAVSIASAFYLQSRYHPLADSSAAVGARYLVFARPSTLGFLPSSVAFSLPRASYLWGVGFIVVQFLFVVSQRVSKFVALVAALVIGGILIYVIYREVLRLSSDTPSCVCLVCTLSWLLEKTK